MTLFYSLIVSTALAFATQAGKTSGNEIRKQIRSTLFVPDPAPVLAPKSHGTFEPEPGVIAERVTYGGQFGMRVPAVVYGRSPTRANCPP
jgi:hypothetical protein